MFKVNIRSTISCSGVFIVNFEYVRHILVIPFFIADFKMKLFVRTIKNSFQLLLFFITKSSILDIA